MGNAGSKSRAAEMRLAAAFKDNNVRVDVGPPKSQVSHGKAQEDVPDLKIFLVGDEHVGKRKLITRFAVSRDEEWCDESTGEWVYQAEASLTALGHRFDMHIYDGRSHADFDRLRPLNYTNTDIFMLCFDCTNLESLKNLSAKWAPELDEKAYPPKDHFLSATRLLVGTKLDLVEGGTSGDAFARLQRAADDEARRVGAEAVVFCSAKSGEGVDKAFTTAVGQRVSHTRLGVK